MMISTKRIRCIFALLFLKSTFVHSGRDENDETSFQEDTKRIRRLAILRPFGLQNASQLSRLFAAWDVYPPCNVTNKDETSVSIIVDIFLSFSQTFDSRKDIAEQIQSIVDTAMSSSWSKCISSIISIENGIEPSMDVYLPSQTRSNMFWVHGPNTQFINSMKIISSYGQEKDHNAFKNRQSYKYPSYDAVFVMEIDVVPFKKYWLDSLLAEAHQSNEFAILGSKYDGDSWNGFRSSLPLALQHHINGNALYNISHTLVQEILHQLELESDTPYHAIPYDVRISQMLVEGMMGIPPDLPTEIVTKWSHDTGRQLPLYNDRFRRWWLTFGAPIKESNVISNCAGVTLLPRHLEMKSASLIHGGKFYDAWDEKKFEITLVVSDWHDELALQLLSSIEKSNHPFKEIVLMLPGDIAWQNLSRLISFQTNIEVKIYRRKKDSYDLCQAPVSTDWFMITNSYHILSKDIDLMFNEGKPVAPFINADHSSCLNSEGCAAIYKEAASLFQPNFKKIVKDSDLLINTSLRDEFCKSWFQKTNQKRNQANEKMPTLIKQKHRMPSATAFLSYLSLHDQLNDHYDFYDTSLYFKRTIFERIYTTEEEHKAFHDGETVLANRLLKEGSVRTPIVSNTFAKKGNYVGRPRRLSQNDFAPSFTPPTIEGDKAGTLPTVDIVTADADSTKTEMTPDTTEPIEEVKSENFVNESPITADEGEENDNASTLSSVKLTCWLSLETIILLGFLQTTCLILLS